MAKRLIFGAGAVIVALILVAVVANELRPNPAARVFSRVNQGMPANAALQTLGKPTVTMPLDPQGRPQGYVWTVPGGRIWVYVRDETVVATELEEDGLRLRTLFTNLLGG